MLCYLGIAKYVHPVIEGMEHYPMNLLVNYLKKEELPLLKDYDNTNLLIDSGGFRYQNINKFQVDKLNDYVLGYRKFVKKNTQDPRIKGFFDLDFQWLDYKQIEMLRGKLFDVSDKIIPVWHKIWGVTTFMEMCKKYDYVAIPCVRNAEIQGKNYGSFVKYAHKNGTKIHGLGQTSPKILDKVPFDTTDSSSWFYSIMYAWYVNSPTKIKSEWVSNNRRKMARGNFLQYLKLCEHYHKKWMWYHND